MNSIIRLFTVLLLVSALVGCQRSNEAPSEEQIERNNRGVALMGQYRNEDARQVFAELLSERPGWTDVEVNLAIATLNRQREGDELVALEIVERILIDHPDHQRARYVAGLMRLYIGDTEQALDHFVLVEASAPDDPHVAYFTGQALGQLDRVEDALARYERAMVLDPYLRSAYYGAALALRQLGRTDEAREYLAIYQRFENNPRAHLAEFVYTRKGVLAEALAVGSGPAAGAEQPPSGSLFDQPVSVAELSLAGDEPSLSTADINGDGHLDLFVAGGPGQGNRILVQDESRWVRLDNHPLAVIDDVRAALWGDLDNSDRLAVVLCLNGTNQAFQRLDDDWLAMDGVSGLGDPHDCADGAMLDADHDGDLDVMIVNRDGPNELYNNDFNGRYRALSETPDGQPLAGEGRASRQILASDLDGDRDADLVVLHDQPPHQVLTNDRLWRYQPAEGFDEFVAAPLLAVTAADLAASGQVDLVSLDQAGHVQRWQPDKHGNWKARELARIEMSGSGHAGIAALDLTGNGRPELLIHHSREIVVLALDTDGMAERLWSHGWSQPAELLALTPILIDPSRGPALAGVVRDGEQSSLMLWPAGSGRHDFVALAPSGLSDTGQGMRSNASGIGTHLVVRSGQHWAIADTYDHHSAPGQSLQPISIGLNGRDRADFVKLMWSDGVLQTEMDLVAGKVHHIAEHQRQLASCPVLYAWNGEEHVFVSDLLGVAGIGFLLEPGRYSDPRPWEFFRFPAGSIAPRDGRYEIKIGEPMEEIAYIDTARLHIHDLPPGWAMSVDERMFTGGGPEPTGEPLFYRESNRLLPVTAINDRGEDVTEAILAADFKAAPPGERHPRFLGRTVDDHVLSLDFGQVINPPGTRPVLVASGWVEYPYSQTLFAAWQAGVEYRPPSLEAYSDGSWQTVYEQFGYPAGMPREMSLPLTDLPTDTTALRLRGNWEVYWDSIMVVQAEPAPGPAQVEALSSDLARLARTGFPRRDTLAQRLPFYDYQDRSPFWDTRYPTGLYTNFGSVLELVSEANNAFAVFGPGEELHLEFVAPPPPPDGWRREVVLEIRGFAKDMDLYTRDGATVSPLPLDPELNDNDQRESLHRATLNRFQGGY